MNNEQILKFHLRDMAEQLEKWASESLRGGWSTHQVEPMRKKAVELYAIIGKMG